MNKRTKLIVSLLFIVIIILAAAVTRFYSSVPDEVSGGVNQPEVARRLASDSEGNDIFEDSSGLCGVLDSRDRVIVAPDWLELSFAGDNTCIASKRIGGRVLFGCIDFEGNVTVPFVYSSITPHQTSDFTFYIAEAAADGQFVVYDGSFTPMFRQSWTGAKFTDGKLILVDKGGIFTYGITKNGALCERAKLSGESLGCAYTMEVTSQIILQKLSTQMLEKMMSDTGVFLEFAYTGKEDLLRQINSATRAFQQLYPDDHKILEKELRGINEIYISNARLEGGGTGFAISVKADTEITYSDETDGKTKKLREECTAKVTFTGSNINDLTAVSGGFSKQSPDYPKPEPPPEYDPETGELMTPSVPEEVPEQQEMAAPREDMFYQEEPAMQTEIDAE